MRLPGRALKRFAFLRSWFSIIATLITVLMVIPLGVSSQGCSGCEVSQQTITKANARLNLDDTEKGRCGSTSLARRSPLPPSNATNEHMIHQPEWITWYDDDLRVPLWVAYELTKADASAQLERKDCFRKDPRLSDEVASTCADHQEPSGFIDTISFILSRLDESVGATNPYLRDHIATIDEIEAVTRIGFLSGSADECETTVEAFRATGLWNTN